MTDQFEWDLNKQKLNLKKHGIDFDDAANIFRGPHIVRSAHPGAGGEERKIAIGSLNEIEIAVVYTIRGKVRRLISARRARQSERTAYRKEIFGQPP